MEIHENWGAISISILLRYSTESNKFFSWFIQFWTIHKPKYYKHANWYGGKKNISQRKMPNINRAVHRHCVNEIASAVYLTPFEKWIPITDWNIPNLNNKYIYFYTCRMTYVLNQTVELLPALTRNISNLFPFLVSIDMLCAFLNKFVSPNFQMLFMRMTVDT